MITFGICVSDKNMANQAVDSIRTIDQIGSIDFEIVAIGSEDQLPDSVYVRKLAFDENEKPKWITRKKNLLARAARWDNVCIIHDYYAFDKNWFKSLIAYNRLHQWDVLQPRILTYEGTRHSDWLVNQKYMDYIIDKYPHLGPALMQVAPNENGPRWVCGLPYDVTELSRIQYISGGYIFAKKHVFIDVPLNENLIWGQAEDLEWSERVIKAGYKFKLCVDQVAIANKPGKWHLHQMTDTAVMLLLKEFT